ncbi:MAG TPA: universal stress protein [Longimicrobiales bacterium]|nr:universal stress protein [Longimicrobiales bacterium]
MIRSILVPLDGSPGAERALPWGAGLARATGAEIHLVTVHVARSLYHRLSPLGGDVVEARVREGEEAYLERQAADVGGELGAEPKVALLTGAPGTALCRHVTRRGIDIIVMSTHGYGGFQRAWLGSVTDAVIRRARVPVLVVPQAAEDAHPRAVPEPGSARILVAVDGSVESEVALAWAWPLCTALSADCTVIRVVVPPSHVIASSIEYTGELNAEMQQAAEAEAETYLQRVLETAPSPAGNVRAEVVTAQSAAHGILRSAEESDADIIVIGTRGHGGATRLLLGSVADKVVRGSRVPVLVCPPPST